MNAIALLNEPIVQRLGWTLIHSLWQGVLIAAALAVVLRLTRSAPANFRYLASCAAMGMIVVAAAITFSQIRIATGPAASTRETGDGYVEVLPPIAPTGPATPAASPSLSDIELQPAHEELRWIVLAWVIGVVAMSLWHVGGWLWLTRMRRGQRLERWEPTLTKLMNRLHIRRAVRLIETSRIDVPAVIGALRPIICVPVGIFSGLSPQQVEAILAHELAHIRRHDYLVNLIQSAIETLMFYHPATWWISAQIRRERENCCDDIAAAICADTRAYASALAALEGHRAGLRIAMAATGGSLIERVRRVLHLPPVEQRPTRTHSVVATALAIACVVVPLACVRAQAQPKQSSTTTQPASDYAYVNVVIGKGSMLYNDKPIDWPELEKVLDAIPSSQRSRTVLAFAAASPDVTVQRYFNVSGRLSKLVKTYGLAYLSDTGIHPTTEPASPASPAAANGATLSLQTFPDFAGFERLQAALQSSQAASAQLQAQVDLLRRTADELTKQAAALRGSTPASMPEQALQAERDMVAAQLTDAQRKFAPDHPTIVALQGRVKEIDERMKQLKARQEAQNDEYYITGVKRTGAYSLSGRKITLKQAIVAAGMPDAGIRGTRATVRRREGDSEKVAADVPVDALMDGNANDLYLSPGDVVLVRPATTTTQSAR